MEVLDRSMVILSIFQRHARTREARIQVEIARLVYMAPRLREANAGGDRQRGGVGGKGAGESALELNRRGARDRIAELRRTLVVVQREADTQRSRRSGSSTQTVTLVGYTNAGKSRLMRALTNDRMYVADQLFATLDTTVRILVPETRPRILISDTVGFIKDLPHDLVASFRSTLAEAKDADLHLHVVDAADPAFRDQYEVTRQVLAEIGAADHPSLVDPQQERLLDAEQRAALVDEFPDAVLMSARSAEDVARAARAHPGVLRTLHGRRRVRDPIRSAGQGRASARALPGHFRALHRGRRPHPCARARVPARWAPPPAVETSGSRQISANGLCYALTAVPPRARRFPSIRRPRVTRMTEADRSVHRIEAHPARAIWGRVGAFDARSARSSRAYEDARRSRAPGRLRDHPGSHPAADERQGGSGLRGRAGGEECVAKVYKEASQRTFKHRAEYTEGRRTRNSRDQRAVNKRTRHGRKQDEAAWRNAEVDTIYRLRDAGVRVPEPINFVDGVSGDGARQE